jgi:GNAT superfamily N-acetyltransferase
MSALSLRDATPDDIPLVVRFVRELAEYEKLAHLATGTEAGFARLLFGTPARAAALIARWHDEPVGLALWFYGVTTFSAQPTLYVEDVFVVPAMRGHGIGRAIFRDLARRAVAEDCARMEWSVLDWNAPSIAFYRSIGARPHEGWTTQRLAGEALTALAAAQG